GAQTRRPHTRSRDPVPPFLLPLAAVAVAPVMLYFGADWLVTGSVQAGRAARIRPMVIGLTLVAFATSAPELVVGVVASLQGVPKVAVGNVIGANVANVGLIIGGSALVAPMAMARSTWRKEIPITLAVQVVLLAFCVGGTVARWEGAVLILLLAAFLTYMILTRRDTDLPDATREVRRPAGRGRHRGRQRHRQHPVQLGPGARDGRAHPPPAGRDGDRPREGAHHDRHAPGPDGRGPERLPRVPLGGCPAARRVPRLHGLRRPGGRDRVG
ncbi:MAG: sodium:calcium antiporter, partial [Planctomycetota bacterium]|nr:sodium:calcium antiporter [Planctomycetota bacterium]